MSQPLTVLQGDISFQADFLTPAFELFRDATTLQKVLYEHLGRFGLGLADMRPDSFITSLADVQLSSSLSRFATTVRLSPERVDVACTDSLRVRQADFADIALTALDAVRGYHPVEFKSYKLNVNFHGTVEGLSTQDFLSRFTTPRPQHLGPSIGSGAVFYYGAEADRVTSFVTLDFSSLHTGALYVRLHATWDATKVALADLATIAEAYILKMVDAIDISLPQPSE